MSLTAEIDTTGAPEGHDHPLLSLRGLTKTFGAVQALRDVDLDIPAGQITALVGDNGAGKSVMIKTIAGIWAPTAGQIYWDGEPVVIRTPKEADHLGIATVYQDLALCDNLDIVQNMFLGHEDLSHRLLDETSMELTAKQTLADLSVTTVSSVRQPVGSLSGGQRQSVAVARAVMRDARLVIMDEPTAALGVSQTAQVIELIRTLGARGIAVIVISHNLNEVFAIADRLAVLYLGRMVSSGPIAEYDLQRAVELITTGQLAGTQSRESDGATGSDPKG
jgi:ABC-type sugar transport system ATPase subunit